jgi:two-component system response regulator YesN
MVLVMKSLKNVFLAEDEIVIRERTDWQAHGLEFCGEAPDGEMALPMN